LKALRALRFTLLGLAVVVVAGSTACGTSEPGALQSTVGTSTASGVPAPYSVRQVVSAFRRADVTLIRLPRSTQECLDRAISLGIPLDESWPLLHSCGAMADRRFAPRAVFVARPSAVAQGGWFTVEVYRSREVIPTTVWYLTDPSSKRPFRSFPTRSNVRVSLTNPLDRVAVQRAFQNLRRSSP
jgi:hypothetical protein